MATIVVTHSDCRRACVRPWSEVNFYSRHVVASDNDGEDVLGSVELEVDVVTHDEEERDIMAADIPDNVDNESPGEEESAEEAAAAVAAAAAAAAADAVADAAAAADAAADGPIELPPAPAPSPCGPALAHAPLTGATSASTVTEKDFLVRLRWVPRGRDGESLPLFEIWRGRSARLLMSCPVLRSDLFKTLRFDGNTSTTIEIVWRVLKHNMVRRQFSLLIVRV